MVLHNFKKIGYVPSNINFKTWYVQTDNKYTKSAVLPVIKSGWELKATQKLPSFIIEPETRRKGNIIPQSSSQISCI